MLPHWSAPPVCISTPSLAVQMQEVRRLQQHVAEFGEAEARFEPLLDRILGEHVRDREMLADVAQEVDQAELAQPVVVVDQLRRRSGPGVKSRNRASWPPDPGDVAHQRLASSAGRGPPIGTTGRRSCPVPPPTSGDRPVAVALQVEQPEDRHEVADVQRIGGRVEAVVGRDRAPGASRSARPGRLVLEHAAPRQLLEEARRERASSGRFEVRQSVVCVTVGARA